MSAPQQVTPLNAVYHNRLAQPIHPLVQRQQRRRLEPRTAHWIDDD